MHLPSNRPIEPGQPLPPVPAHLRARAAEWVAAAGQPRTDARAVPHFLNLWALQIQSQQRISWHRATDEYQTSRFRSRWQQLYTQTDEVVALLEAAFTLEAESVGSTSVLAAELHGKDLWGEVYPAVVEHCAPITAAVAAATTARSAYLHAFHALVKEEQQYRATLPQAA